MEGRVLLNEGGRIVQKWWRRIGEKFPLTSSHAYVVMPNHFHGIVMIREVGAVPCDRPGNMPMGKAYLPRIVQ